MFAAPKLARLALLMTAFAGLSAATLAVAQDDKKPTKKSKSKADDAKVLINQGKDGKYRFAIYAGKKFVGQGGFGGYGSFDEAVEAFEEFKAAVNSAGKPVVGKKMEKSEEDEKEAKGKKKPE